MNATKYEKSGVGSAVLANQSFCKFPTPASAIPCRKYWFWLEVNRGDWEYAMANARANKMIAENWRLRTKETGEKPPLVFSMNRIITQSSLQDFSNDIINLVLTYYLT